jgi:NAD+ synthase
MFEAIKVKNDIVQWIKNWFDENGNNCNAVIGISGGKDSSVVAALCVEALGKDRVIGVLMPNGKQNDIGYAYDLCAHLGIQYMLTNIQYAVDGVFEAIELNKLNPNSLHIQKISEQTRINLPPRIRMATLYAVSQSINGRVACTDNLSESYIGYSTRWGDSVGDFSPIRDLTATEVKAIGYALGLPKELVDKTPADGLCDKTDEDNFGFTYDVLDKYIRTGQIENTDIQKRIDAMHQKNTFKLKPIPKFNFK